MADGDNLNSVFGTRTLRQARAMRTLHEFTPIQKETARKIHRRGGTVADFIEECGLRLRPDSCWKKVRRECGLSMRQGVKLKLVRRGDTTKTCETCGDVSLREFDPNIGKLHRFMAGVSDG